MSVEAVSVIKFNGNDVACKMAACGRDAAFSEFLTTLTKNFMASDMSMPAAFDATKIEFAAKQMDIKIPKLPVIEVTDSKTQTVAGIAQSGNGRSA
jgi:hypothetical protein